MPDNQRMASVQVPEPSKPIAITMGDAAGIGPEIIAKAFRDHPAGTRHCFVAGDVEAIRNASRLPVLDVESTG